MEGIFSKPINRFIASVLTMAMLLSIGDMPIVAYADGEEVAAVESSIGDGENNTDVGSGEDKEYPAETDDPVETEQPAETEAPEATDPPEEDIVVPEETVEPVSLLDDGEENPQRYPLYVVDDEGKKVFFNNLVAAYDALYSEKVIHVIGDYVGYNDTSIGSESGEVRNVTVRAEGEGKFEFKDKKLNFKNVNFTFENFKQTNDPQNTKLFYVEEITLDKNSSFTFNSGTYIFGDDAASTKIKGTRTDDSASRVSVFPNGGETWYLDIEDADVELGNGAHVKRITNCSVTMSYPEFGTAFSSIDSLNNTVAGLEVIIHNGTLRSGTIEKGVVRIDGGTVYNLSTENSRVTINGGSVNTSLNSTNDKSFVITDGNINAPTVITNTSGSAQVKGGIFRSDFLATGSRSNIIITGGYFKNTTSAENYLPDGYIMAKYSPRGESGEFWTPVCEAFKVGGKGYYTLDEAVRACPADGTILVNADVGDVGAFIGKSLTLDLNGHKLSAKSGGSITVSDNVTLAVSDSIGGGELGMAVRGMGIPGTPAVLSVTGGTVTGSVNFNNGEGRFEISGGTVANISMTYGTALLSDGTVTEGSFIGNVTITISGGTHGALTVAPGAGEKLNFTNGTAASLTVESGEAEIGGSANITSTLTNRGVVSVNGSIGGAVTNSGTLTISGGTVNGGITNSSTGTLAVTGGIVNGRVANDGTMTAAGGTFNDIVNGIGTFTVESGSTFKNDLIAGTSSTSARETIINGGSFEADVSTVGKVEIRGGTFENKVGALSENTAENEISISGGTFKGSVTFGSKYFAPEISGGVFEGQISVIDEKNPMATGGKFKSIENLTFGEGYAAVKKDDGYYYVQPIGDNSYSVNGAMYNDLQNALDACGSGRENIITVLKNAEVNDNAAVKYNSTLDLNGHTLTIAEGKALSVPADKTFDISGGEDGIINGKLTVSGTATVSGAKIGAIENSGSLTLSSANIGELTQDSSVKTVFSGAAGSIDTLIVINGEVELTDGKVNEARIAQGSGKTASIVINGAEVTDKISGTAGSVTVKSGTVASIDINGHLTIEDGIFSGSVSAKTDDDFKYIISGGTFNGAVVLQCTRTAPEISGGTFESTVGAGEGGSFKKPVASDGKFKDISGINAAEGRTFVERDGYYVLVYAKDYPFSVNGRVYAKLSEAVAACSATEESTINVLYETNVFETVSTQGKNIVLNLNGLALTIVGEDHELTVTAGSKLTVSDGNGTNNTKTGELEGKVNVLGEIAANGIRLESLSVAEHGKAVVTGCTAVKISNAGELTLSGSTVAELRNSSTELALADADNNIDTLYIEDGNIALSNGTVKYITANAGTALISGGTVDGTVTVSGGTVTATGGRFRIDPTGAVTPAEGYSIYREGEYYIVAVTRIIEAGGRYFTTFKAALDYAETVSGTANLNTLCSFALTEESYEIKSGVKVVLDLGGFTASGASDIAVNGELTVKNGTLGTAAASVTVNENGKLTLESDAAVENNIIVVSGGTLDSAAQLGNIVNSGTAAITGGTVGTVTNNAGASLTVTDGTVTGITNSGTLTLNGGTAADLTNSAGAETTINNITVSGTVNNSGKITVKGGNVNNLTNSNGGEITIEDITLEGNLTNSGTITAAGGKFKNNPTGSVTIPKDYEINERDGYFWVEKAKNLKCGEEYFATLEEAFEYAASVNGEAQIEVLRNFALDADVTLEQGVLVTLDLGGFTIGGNRNLTVDGRLTVKNGSFGTELAAGTQASRINVNGTLTLESTAVISNAYSIEAAQGAVLNTAAKLESISAQQGAAVTVSGGEVQSIDNAGELEITAGSVNTVNNGSQLTVSGGSVAVLTNNGEATVSSGTVGTVTNNADASLTVSGGSVQTLTNHGEATVSSGTVAELSSDGTLTVSGGTVTGLTNQGTLTLDGGTVADLTNSAGAETVINNVTISGTVNNSGKITAKGGTVNNLTNGNGGEITIENITLEGIITNSGTITVTGGKFKNDPTASVTIPRGYRVNERDGYFWVEKAQNLKCGEEYFATLDEAFEYAGSVNGEAEIEVLKSFDLDADVTLERGVWAILDLGGFTIGGNRNLTVDGRLTVKNGSFGTELAAGAEASRINVNGTLTLESTAVISNAYGIEVAMGASLNTAAKLESISAQQGTVVSVSGGEVQSIESAGILTITAGSVHTAISNNKVTVSGGSVGALISHGEATVSGGTVAELSSDGTLTVSGGTVTGLTNQGTLILDGGTVAALTNSADAETVINNAADIGTVDNSGTVTVQSGTVGSLVNSANAALNIYGGTVTAITNNGTLNIENGTVSFVNNGTVNVKGGIVNSAEFGPATVDSTIIAGTFESLTFANDPAKLYVTGGSFKTDPTGKVTIDEGNEFFELMGYYVLRVHPTVRVEHGNSVFYANGLNAALSQMTDEGSYVVKLLEDITETQSISLTSGQELELVFNGHKITGIEGLINVESGAKLWLSDDGEIANANYPIKVSGEIELVSGNINAGIELASGGSLIAGKDSDITINAPQYAVKAADGAALNIQGGSFLGSGVSASGKHNITGGFFKNDITALIADDTYACIKVQDEDLYKVVAAPIVVVSGTAETRYEKLSDAFAAVQSGDTVKLIQDYTVGYDDVSVTAANSCTFDLNGKTLKGYIRMFGNNAAVTVTNGTAQSISGYGIDVTAENLTVTETLEVRSAMGGGTNKLTVNSGNYKKVTASASIAEIIGGTIENLECTGEAIVSGGEVTGDAILWNGKVTDGIFRGNVELDGEGLISNGQFYGSLSVGATNSTRIEGGEYYFAKSYDWTAVRSCFPDQYYPTYIEATDDKEAHWEIINNPRVSVIEVISGGTSKHYESFEAAMSQLKAGDTVKLLTTVKFAEPQTVAVNNVTFDFNGYSLGYTGDGDAITVSENVTGIHFKNGSLDLSGSNQRAGVHVGKSAGVNFECSISGGDYAVYNVGGSVTMPRGNYRGKVNAVYSKNGSLNAGYEPSAHFVDVISGEDFMTKSSAYEEVCRIAGLKKLSYMPITFSDEVELSQDKVKEIADQYAAYVNIMIRGFTNSNKSMASVKFYGGGDSVFIDGGSAALSSVDADGGIHTTVGMSLNHVNVAGGITLVGNSQIVTLESCTINADVLRLESGLGDANGPNASFSIFGELNRIVANHCEFLGKTTFSVNGNNNSINVRNSNASGGGKNSKIVDNKGKGTDIDSEGSNYTEFDKLLISTGDISLKLVGLVTHISADAYSKETKLKIGGIVLGSLVTAAITGGIVAWVVINGRRHKAPDPTSSPTKPPEDKTCYVVGGKANDTEEPNANDAEEPNLAAAPRRYEEGYLQTAIQDALSSGDTITMIKSAHEKSASVSGRVNFVLGGNVLTMSGTFSNSGELTLTGGTIQGSGSFSSTGSKLTVNGTKLSTAVKISGGEATLSEVETGDTVTITATKKTTINGGTFNGGINISATAVDINGAKVSSANTSALVLGDAADVCIMDGTFTGNEQIGCVTQSAGSLLRIMGGTFNGDLKGSGISAPLKTSFFPNIYQPDKIFAGNTLISGGTFEKSSVCGLILPGTAVKEMPKATADTLNYAFIADLLKKGNSYEADEAVNDGFASVSFNGGTFTGFVLGGVVNCNNNSFGKGTYALLGSMNGFFDGQPPMFFLPTTGNPDKMDNDFVNWISMAQGINRVSGIAPVLNDENFAMAANIAFQTPSKFPPSVFGKGQVVMPQQIYNWLVNCVDAFAKSHVYYMFVGATQISESFKLYMTLKEYDKNHTLKNEDKASQHSMMDEMTKRFNSIAGIDVAKAVTLIDELIVQFANNAMTELNSPFKSFYGINSGEYESKIPFEHICEVFTIGKFYGISEGGSFTLTAKDELSNGSKFVRFEDAEGNKVGDAKYDAVHHVYYLTLKAQSRTQKLHYVAAYQQQSDVAEIVREGSEPVRYETFGAAFAAAKSGDEIRLLDNCALPDTACVLDGADKEITINLNGYTLTNAAVDTSYIEAKNGAKLTFVDSGTTKGSFKAVKSKDASASQELGRLRAGSGGIIETVINIDASDVNTAVHLGAQGKWIVPEGAEIEVKSNVSNHNTETGAVISIASGRFDKEIFASDCAPDYVPKNLGDGWWTVEKQTIVAVVIRDGEEVARCSSFAAAAAKIESGDTIRLLENCSLPDNGTAFSNVTITIDFNGHVLSTADTNISELKAANGATLKFIDSSTEHNGKFKAVPYAASKTGTQHRITIEGNSVFELSVSIDASGVDNAVRLNNGGKWIVPEGTDITVTSDEANHNNFTAGTATVSIASGRFSKEIFASDCAPGYIPKALEDNWWTVEQKKVVAIIRNGEEFKQYQSFAAACEELVSEDTIKLLEDCSLPDVGTTFSDLTVTVDFSGHVLSTTESASSNISVSSGATLKFIDSSTEKNGLFRVVAGDSSSGIDSKIRVGYNATFELSASIDASAAQYAVFLHTGDENLGKWIVPEGTNITVKSGTANYNPTTKSTISIASGRFDKEIFASDCAPGYVPKNLGDGWWTVDRPEVVLSLYSRLVNGGNYSVAKVSGGGIKHVGEEVTIIAENAEGMTFDGWYYCTLDDEAAQKVSFGKLFSREQTHIFTMPEEDVTLAAVYRWASSEKAKLTVTWESDDAKPDAPANMIKVNGVLQEPDHAVYSELPLGSLVVLECLDTDHFRFWTNGNGSDKIISGSSLYIFPLASDSHLVADCYRSDETEYANVEFVSAYNQIMGSYKVMADAKPEEMTAMPPIPSKLGGVEGIWSIDGVTRNPWASVTWAEIIAYIKDNPDDHYVQVKAIYRPGTGMNMIRIIEDGIERTEPLWIFNGDSVTVPAKDIENKVFMYWTDEEGKILSYNQNIYLIASRDKTICAVYGENAVTAAPVINITSVYISGKADTAKISFEATRSVPEGYEVLEHGIIRTTNAETGTAEKLILDGSGVSKMKAATMSLDGVFTANLKVSTDTAKQKTVWVRGYMVLLNTTSGEMLTVYSPIVYDSYQAVLTRTERSTNG